MQRVYNITVEGEHVYRVSLLGALVHNVVTVAKTAPVEEMPQVSNLRYCSGT